jgi:hypothetical protein
MPAGSRIGQSVGASSLMEGGPSLSDQVAGETEEQRKKRLAGMQAARQLPVGMSSLADGYGSALSVT